MTEPLIHPTAIVDKAAQLHGTVRVGPYAVIGPSVVAEEGVVVGPHAVITGSTTLRKGARIFQFASIGDVPQDLKFKGEDTRVFIGEDTQIREFVSIHKGTVTGRKETRVGARCMVMSNAHIAHDCIVEDDVIIAGGTMLAGHVTIGTQVIISGLVGIHQFVRVGRNAFLAGGAIVVEDVMPFCFAQGDRARLRGLNLEGLKRRGYSKERIESVKRAYKILFREKRTLEDAVATLTKVATTDDARAMLEFARRDKRSLMRP
ncbi:MAG: acyl-ACP--UDP-N-acetylglucosamine O-acyltransferase [Deltaproteobacteria bacterium]|nr:acyl-ACP--UDP-N-acetylglucosamine O-acyltransferase [Deltaproteobacteria bacterium]